MNRRAPLPTDEELEGQLFTALTPARPVQPNPEFVRRLKHRLTSQPAVTVEHRTEATVFVILAGALFSGALLVWLIFSLKALLNRASRTR